PRISECNAGVPHKAPPLRPLYGAAAKHSTKFLLGERDQPLQVRRKKRMLRNAARFEIWGGAYRGAAIPGTHVLADVASENVPPHRLSKVLWNRATQLDGQIGDTAASVQHVGLDDGAGRTRFDAQPAVPAQIRRRHAGRAERRDEIERRHNYAEEQPRARFFVDKACVLCEPAEPRVLRRNALDDGPRIHVDA